MVSFSIRKLYMFLWENEHFSFISDEGVKLQIRNQHLFTYPIHHYKMCPLDELETSESFCSIIFLNALSEVNDVI